MKLIAIATSEKCVAQHFGHCEGFTVYQLEEGKNPSPQFYPNPGHKPGFLPEYLGDLGVQVIIAGGMGAGAVNLFAQKSIQVITGASGVVEEALHKYLKGELVSSGSVCNAHEHSNGCDEH